MAATPLDQPNTTDTTPLPAGRIDIHCHLIPGVDDGCQNLEQSIESITRLKTAGYVGSICTPHIWLRLYPENVPVHIRAWTARLQHELDQRAIDYRLWPGGELRLFKGVVEWMKHNEVPTLAGSRYVLTDFWEPHWPKWIDRAFDWLLAEGYKPILAHPERASINDLPARLDEIASRGVLLQGNFRPMTGEDGFLADQWVRQFLHEGRYTFLALDAHGPDSLQSRLDGLNMVAQEFGPDVVDEKTMAAPRRLILGLDD